MAKNTTNHKWRTDDNFVLDQLFADLPLAKPVSNISLYYRAFTHTSYAYEHQLATTYERLEFLGDAVLQLAVTEFLFASFPDLGEGKLTIYRSQAVRNQTLAQASQYYHLDQYILLGHGEQKAGGQEKTAILADVFEAFIAAIYLDQGMAVVKAVLKPTLFAWLSSDQISIVNYKTKLQETVHGKVNKGVDYDLVRKVKLRHNQSLFIVHAKINKIILGKGRGNSKKEASINAAADALNHESNWISLL